MFAHFKVHLKMYTFAINSKGNSKYSETYVNTYAF